MIITSEQALKGTFTQLSNTAILGDCLEVLKSIPTKSVHCIITDPPYGTTACKWDSVIPVEPMWAELNRIIIDNGVVALFGSEPFSSFLRHSNLSMYKYDWKWKKTKAVGFQHSKNKPMKILEDILVFSKGSMGHVSQLQERRMRYNPQGVIPVGTKVVSAAWHGNMMGERPNQVGKEYLAFTNFPNELLEYKQPIGKKSIHPTQKPVKLIEYLIKTYTDEAEIVLDFASGSFTTAIACLNTNRRFICIEKNQDYFNLGVDRIRNREEQIVE